MFVIETDSIGTHLYPGPQPNRNSHFTFYQDPFFGFCFPTQQAGQQHAINQLGFTPNDDDTTQPVSFRLVDRDEAKSRFQTRIANGMPMGEREYVRPENQQPVCLDGLNETERQIALLSWWLLVYKPTGSNLSYSTYKVNSDAMWEHFKQLRIGLGYQQDINQVSLKLITGKNFNPKQAADELWLAWPWINESSTNMLGHDDLYGKIVDIDNGDWASGREDICLVFQSLSVNHERVKVTLMRRGYDDQLFAYCSNAAELALFLNHPVFAINHDEELDEQQC